MLLQMSAAAAALKMSAVQQARQMSAVPEAILQGMLATAVQVHQHRPAKQRQEGSIVRTVRQVQASSKLKLRRSELRHKMQMTKLTNTTWKTASLTTLKLMKKRHRLT